MYILLITILAWAIQQPSIYRTEKLCNKAQIELFAKPIDKYHWYFHSYLYPNQLKKLELEISKLNCNLATKYQKTRIVEYKKNVTEITMSGLYVD